MHIGVTVSSFRGKHRMTVFVNPHDAAALGQHVLMEGQLIPNLDDESSALQVLREAWIAIAEEIKARQAEGLPVES